MTPKFLILILIMLEAIFAPPLKADEPVAANMPQCLAQSGAPLLGLSLDEQIVRRIMQPSLWELPQVDRFEPLTLGSMVSQRVEVSEIGEAHTAQQELARSSAQVPAPGSTYVVFVDRKGDAPAEIVAVGRQQGSLNVGELSVRNTLEVNGQAELSNGLLRTRSQADFHIFHGTFDSGVGLYVMSGAAFQFVGSAAGVLNGALGPQGSVAVELPSGDRESVWFALSAGSYFTGQGLSPMVDASVRLRFR